MRNKHGVMIPEWLGDIWYNTWWSERAIKGSPHQDVPLESCYVEPRLGGLKHPGLGTAKKLNS